MPPCGPLQPAMADGTILIKWLAPLLAVAAAVAEVEEPAVGQAELARQQAGHPLVVPVARAEEAVEAVVVEVEAELQQPPRHRRTFSAPNKICCMSPI